MRKFALLLAGAAALITAPAVQARDYAKGEARLAKMLDGRVPGKPVSCLSHFQTRDMQVIDGTALVYKVGRTLYVNRTQDPRSIDSNEILVNVQRGSQLCSVDTMRQIDRTSGMFSGVVFLSEFVPYTRAG